MSVFCSIDNLFFSFLPKDMSQLLNAVPDFISHVSSASFKFVFDEFKSTNDERDDRKSDRNSPQNTSIILNPLNRNPRRPQARPNRRSPRRARRAPISHIPILTRPLRKQHSHILTSSRQAVLVDDGIGGCGERVRRGLALES